MSKTLNEKHYNFSECISKANYYMREAFYWNKGAIYAKSVKFYALNAEAWFKMAKIAQKKGSVLVAIPSGRKPVYQAIGYSYMDKT